MASLSRNRIVAIRIALVDDNLLFREAMREQLRREGDFDVVGEARSGMEAIDIAQRLRPDIMLLDISLSDLSGINVMKRLRLDNLSVSVIALSSYSEKHFVLEMLKAGARGYLCKIDGGDIANAVRAVASGEIYLSRATL
jgi:DNA-binding NarL/FixJ family response regulator